MQDNEESLAPKYVLNGQCSEKTVQMLVEIKIIVR